MVRSGHIVAQRLRCMLTQKDRACIQNERQHFPRVFRADFQMLRRNFIGQIRTSLQIRADNRRPEIMQGSFDDIFSGQVRRLTYDFRIHLLRQFCAGG